MCASNFYAALGVREDAPIDEICRAYQQYAPFCHPDSKDYDQTMFPIKDLTQQEYWLLINEACEVLTNAELRARYNINTLKHCFPVYEFSGDCFGLYEKFFIHPRSIALMPPDENNNQPSVPAATPCLTMPYLIFPLELELEEIFQGTIKTLSFPRTMTVDGRSCTVMQSLDFTIAPYMRPGGKYILKGFGHQIGDVWGDVEVVLHLKPHQIFTLSGDDLVYVTTVPLSTALLGGNLKLKTIDSKPVSCYICPPFPTGRPLVKRFVGEGMHTATGRGNLIVKIWHTLPRVPSYMHSTAERIIREMEMGNK